ncbi:MAG TPA: nitroreductase family protein [Actinomycetota bacterium]|nr:nitroreductase family protein [Actinomycetota bacterium]
MDLAEAMETQRAIRKLLPDPVDDEVLLRCLRLATKAPTGGNRQGVEFLLVRDDRKKAALGRLYRIAWSVYGGAGRLLYGRREQQRKIMDAVDWQLAHWQKIPVLVVVCLRGLPLPFPSVARTARYGSVYPAIQNFLLAARAEGLGAALTTLPLWSRIAVHRVLDIPWSVEPVAVIPVGWPRGRYGPTSRRAVERSIHVDRYGNRPFESR